MSKVKFVQIAVAPSDSEGSSQTLYALDVEGQVWYQVEPYREEDWELIASPEKRDSKK